MGKRMYYVFKMILETMDKGITAQEIIESLHQYSIDIGVKAVYSCIHQINQFFYEWLHDDIIVSIKKTGFAINKEFFEDGELQFLLDSIAFHQDLKSEDKKHLQDKLLLLSSYHQQARLLHFQSSEKMLHFSLFLNLTTIMKAIENKNVLSFQYINYEIQDHHLKEVPSTNGNISDQYILSPYQIVSQNNHYYVIGYNQKYKNELSTYRIDRMRFIQTIHQSFQDIREQFDMIDEIEKMTNMYISHQRDTLKLECDHKVLRELASRFGMDIHIQKLYQEHYLVTIENTPISEGLIGWLMMMQEQVKVISPNSLQEEMKKRIVKIASLYTDMVQ